MMTSATMAGWASTCGAPVTRSARSTSSARGSRSPHAARCSVARPASSVSPGASNICPICSSSAYGAATVRVRESRRTTVSRPCARRWRLPSRGRGSAWLGAGEPRRSSFRRVALRPGARQARVRRHGPRLARLPSGGDACDQLELPRVYRPLAVEAKVTCGPCRRPQAGLVGDVEKRAVERLHTSRYEPRPAPSLGAPASASDRAQLRGDRVRHRDRRSRSAAQPATLRRPRSRVRRLTRQASRSVPEGRSLCRSTAQLLPPPARAARPSAVARSIPRGRRLQPRPPGPPGWRR